MVTLLGIRSRQAPVLFAIGIFLIGALLIASCDSNVSPAPGGQKRYLIGNHVQAGPWLVTVTQVGTNFGQNGLKPKQGDNFLVIYILLTNTTSQNQTLASGVFSLKDSAGKPANEMKSLTQYTSQQAPPGNSIQGAIVFEVSTTHPNFTLSLSLAPSESFVWNIQVPTFSGPQSTATP